MAKRESIGQRLRRIRSERGLSQQDLSSAGVSYAYISRIEAGARTPSVKALRQLASKLGVTVEHLETGKRTPVEQGVELAGLDFGSLTAKELRAVESAADEGARRVLRPDLLRGAEPLVGLGRRHLDIHDCDVGLVQANLQQQILCRAALSDDLESRLLEQARDALA
jgi:transcriptional regulator with XRE-family HTH domain